MSYGNWYVYFRRTRLQLAFRVADVEQRCEGWICISRGSKEPDIPAFANLQYFQRNQVSNRSICSCIEYLPRMESKLGDGSLRTKTSSSGDYSQLERNFRSQGSISHASLFLPSKESLRLWPPVRLREGIITWKPPMRILRSKGKPSRRNDVRRHQLEGQKRDVG